MPASKRSSESHSPQAKMMKLDGDEEATPGTNSSSHQTEDAHERTAPPWTKRKDPPAAREEDEEVSSILHQSKPSARLNDSDPPLKKAKLFIATSASSGTASPETTESKASQKRPASTELSRTASSEFDGELSSECKTSFFTHTDAADVSRGVTERPDQAKHAATESTADQTVSQSVTSQTPDAGTPPYLTDTDHNYGRASEGSSDGSVVDEAANTETNQLSGSTATGAETTECANSTPLPSLADTPDSVIQSSHPAAEARRPEGEEPTLSTTEAGSSTQHVNNKDVATLHLVRPNEKHEQHKTEVPSARTSREPDSQNHIVGKTVEPPAPAETSDPGDSDRNPCVTAEVSLSTSQSEGEWTRGLVKPGAITAHHTGPGAEPPEEETQDSAPDMSPDINPIREVEQLTPQDVAEPTSITEVSSKAGLESSPAFNQPSTTNCYQEQVLAGPSEVSVTPADTLVPPEREDKTLIVFEKKLTDEPVLPDLVAPVGAEMLANCSGVNPVAESLGSQSGVQAYLCEGNRVVSVAEESIAAPESSSAVQQVHDIHDDSTVSSSTEVVVTNSEEHVGSTVYESVTVQEPEITSNLDSTTTPQGMCDGVPAESSQAEVMQNVDTSTGALSDVSAQVVVRNPDSRQVQYGCVSERVTVQESQSTPNLVSTTTDPIPTEQTQLDGTQHPDVTPGMSSDGPEHLPDTESEGVSEYVTEGEVQPEVMLSSSTAVFEEAPDVVDVVEATMVEEVSQKVGDDSAVPGSSHGWDHVVARPSIDEEQDNVNMESTATLEVSSTMSTECILHYKAVEHSTHLSSLNGENNEVISDFVAETSVNMDSTPSDELIHGQAQLILEGGRHSETNSADNRSLDIDTQIPQRVIMNAGGKEGETVISEYVPERKTAMKVGTEMSLPAPIKDLEDKEIQGVNNDCTGISSEPPKHQTLSSTIIVTSDCVGDQATAPYMEMAETKPVHSPQIDAAMSITASLQPASPVSNKEIIFQKDSMAIDKCVLIGSAQMSQNQDKISEYHPTTSEVMNEHNQHVNNGTNQCPEVSTHPLIIMSESAENVDVITSECMAVPETVAHKNMQTTSTPEENMQTTSTPEENMQTTSTPEENMETNSTPKENMQTTCTPDEMHEPGTEGHQGNHCVDEHVSTEDEEKAEGRIDKMEAGLHTAASACVSYSIASSEQQIQVIHEEPIAVGNYVEGHLVSNAELGDKETTMEAVAYLTSGDHRDEDEMTSMDRKAHYVLEEEKQEVVGRVIDEIEVNASLSSTTGQCEAQGNSEVIVFVCGQQGDVVVQSSTVNRPDGEDVTEHMVIQSEGEAKDFQVVYEAISSPESTIDEEVSVVPEMPGSALLSETQEATISMTREVNILISPTQEADEPINGKTPACLPDSQSEGDIETMVCEVNADRSDVLPIEHADGAVAMGDVLVVTSDKVPEANIQKSEATVDVLETTSNKVPEENMENAEERRDVLPVTTSDEAPEQNMENTEERRDVLPVTTSDEAPEQNMENAEERRDVLPVTTSDESPDQNMENAEERRDVLPVTTSDEAPEQNMENTEERRDVLPVTTSDEAPEQNMENTEERRDVLPVTTSDEAPEQNMENAEERRDVLPVTTSDEAPEQNMENTEERRDVLPVTTSDEAPEQNMENAEERRDVLPVTTSDEAPEQNMENAEERRDVLPVTTSDEAPEQNMENTEERRDVLPVATSDEALEPSFQKTEEMEEGLMVATSNKVPEQNIQNTEASVDVLVETTSNHMPERGIQKTGEISEVLVVATHEEIPELSVQQMKGMEDVLVVTTCDDMPEPTMQQTGDEKEAIEDANGALEMQKDNGQLSQETPISTAVASSETPDSLPQEEFMDSLTVPESADDMDIITQAAAASGLTTSLSEHLNSDDQMVEADEVLNLNGTSQSFYTAIDVQQYHGMDQNLVASSNEESGGHVEVMSATDTAPVALLEKDIPLVPNADQQEEKSAENNHHATRHETETLAVSELQTPTYENASVEMTESVDVSLENAEGDMQILVDMELGHQVEVQDESEMDDPDIVIIEKSHSEVETLSMRGENVGEKSPTSTADITTSTADITTCAADITTSTADITTSNANITTITANITTITADITSTADIPTSTADITTRTADITTSNADNSRQKAEETINKTSMPSITPDPKAEVTVEKPKKQQMNTQARTKARLAAIAEQKVVASKRAAQRQQLNLLALCEEIAEDIATDSMLLKRIEEEKLAVAAATAAKIEAMKKESPPVDQQEATSVPPTPAGPQACSPLVNTANKASAGPTTITTIPEPAEAKTVAPEPPKRRFFVSQIVVPLKAHEKKKLTRYQRLRQVELQREKMSWTRVKKLKTDQAHQMFSDIDFDSSNPFLMPRVATPVANKSIKADTITASTSTSTPSTLPATPAVPEAAATKPDQSKAVVMTPDMSKAVTTPDQSQVLATTDSSKTVTTTDPSKAETTTDTSKVVTTKPDQKETVPPKPGRPRREAATPKVAPAKVASSKAGPQKTVPPKVTSAQGPTPKVTRSSTRKTLPAKPPPMPNGMNTQKAKSEMEYKPYRPRPKYSFEDFELDDDPPPVVYRRPMPQQRPGQQAGPCQQSTSTNQVRPMLQSTNPTAQSRTTPPSKPLVSSQLAGQTKPILQSTPARQISGQSKPATSTPVQSRPATSTSVQSRPATSTPVQSRPATSTSVQSRPATSTSVQSRPATSTPVQSRPATSTPVQSRPATSTPVNSKPVTSTPVQSKPLASAAPHPETVTSKAPQTKPFAPSISQSKPSIAAALQLKTTIAATAQPISADPSELKQNLNSDPVCSVPGKAIPSGFPASQTSPAGPTTARLQPGSLKAEVEVKPPAETPVSISADPQPDVSMETLGVQPPATQNAKCEDEVSPPPPSSLPSEEQHTFSDRTEPTEEKPEASPPEEQAEAAKPAEKTPAQPSERRAGKAESNTAPLSEASLQKEVKKLKEADKDGTQTIIDAGQKHFGAVACSVCGMLYSAANPEDETQHILFHNQFISAVKYVGWKKERILGEYPDGRIILVLPDDPKYALKKVEEIREMVDNDLGFQQVETKCPSQTKTFLFISHDKKVAGCLIAEHIQEGYRVIVDPLPEGSEREQQMFEGQRAWCCSSTAEPAICGVSRIWVFSMMRRQGIASRMIECLRNNFIYGSCLGKEELAFSDPTPDGKLFATQYFGTSRFLVYNFVSGTRLSEPKTSGV